MNLKKTLLLLLAMLIGFTMTAYAAADKATPEKTYTNIAGEISAFDKIPLLIGGKIIVPEGTTNDTIAVGGIVHLGGIISQNALISAGDLTMDTAIGQNALLIAGKANLSDKNSVGQNTLIIAGDANVSGHYLQDMLIIAGKVKISGQVDGDVRVIGGSIEVTPTARIAGSLHYISADPIKVDQGAIISGGVGIWQPMPAKPAKPMAPAPKPSAFHIPGLMFNIGLFVIGLFAALIMPGFCRGSLQKLTGRPWISLLTGFLTLVAVPIAVVLLLITIIGIPLALVGFLLYLAALLVAYVFISMGIGALVLKIFRQSIHDAGRGKLILSVLIGIIVLYLLCLIPFVGGWISFIAFLFGLGMLMLAVFKCCNGVCKPVTR